MQFVGELLDQHISIFEDRANKEALRKNEIWKVNADFVHKRASYFK